MLPVQSAPLKTENLENLKRAYLFTFSTGGKEYGPRYCTTPIETCSRVYVWRYGIIASSPTPPYPRPQRRKAGRNCRNIAQQPAGAFLLFLTDSPKPASLFGETQAHASMDQGRSVPPPPSPPSTTDAIPGPRWRCELTARVRFGETLYQSSSPTPHRTLPRIKMGVQYPPGHDLLTRGYVSIYATHARYARCLRRQDA